MLLVLPVLLYCIRKVSMHTNGSLRLFASCKTSDRDLIKQALWEPVHTSVETLTHVSGVRKESGDTSGNILKYIQMFL